MTEPLPVATIEELERLEREATAGPWTDRFVTHESPDFGHERRFVQVEQGAGEMLFQREVASIDAHDFGKRIARYQSDAKLLCALRNAAPALLAAARRVAELEAELSAVYNHVADNLRVSTFALHGLSLDDAERALYLARRVVYELRDTTEKDPHARPPTR